MAENILEQIGAIDAELAGLHTRTGELIAARSALTQQLGANGLAAAGVELGSRLKTWANDEYALNIAALGELGFDKKTIETDVPAYEQVRDGLYTLGGHLGDRRTLRAVDELVIAPSLQGIGLKGTTRKPGLIPRFDKKQNGVDTVVWSDLWGQFADKDPLHDNGTNEAFPVAVLLDDTQDPRPGTSKKANAYDEVGLVYTGMTVEKQREALAHDTTMHKVVGRELRSATIAQIVVANAKRRLECKPFLDQRTFTRLTHYPDKVVDGVAYVPFVNSRDSRLGLDGSDVDYGWVSYGVRRVLGVPVKA